MTPAPDLTQLIDIAINDSESNELIDQLVAATRLVSELEETADALVGHFVDRCRKDGMTWLEISSALGVSKQAAHKRFSALTTDHSPRTWSSASQLEQEFEQSCRIAIADVQRLGFMPGGWIGLIDQHGAVGAAHHLLSTGRILPLFQFLVGVDRLDLSVERAVLRPKWRSLFDESDRAEARRRLHNAGSGLASEGPVHRRPKQHMTSGKKKKSRERGDSL